MLYRRIRKAILKQEPFCVIIVFPQPEEVGRWAVPTLLRQLRTASSLLERLSEEFQDINVGDYIQFYQLRSYGYIKDRPVTDQVSILRLYSLPDIYTSQIFVHSKMMIVDDRVAIIGSNNVSLCYGFCG